MQDHGLGQATTVVAAIPCGPAGMGDRQLLEDTEAWEALGRLVDARRVALAGEVAWRSREQLGEHGLARRSGDRDATDLLARELLISGREARKRTALGVAGSFAAVDAGRGAPRPVGARRRRARRRARSAWMPPG